MPRRGGQDVPQPILHPIASHATFNTAAAPEAAPSPAATTPSSSRQQGNKSRTEPPASDHLSFSYLRSRKLEPYLPPPVDEHHPPPSLTLTHNFARPPPPPPQHQHHHPELPAQQQTSPESPAASPPASSAHGNDNDDEEDEEEEEGDHELEPDWRPRPFTTLTYAQSLDSALASAPGARTAISGPATKAMTHFLRSRHDAILVGCGTAAADDPGLNCRLEVEMSGGHQPRPVVLDPRARWEVGEGSKVVQLARGGRGLGPWVLFAEGIVPDPARVRAVEAVGGRYLAVEGVEAVEGEGEGEDGGSRLVMTWDNIFGVLWEEGINSVMVEGGGTVINDLLLLANEGLDVVDSVIITIAPVWLGSGAVTVAPERPVDADMRRVPGPRLTDVMWSQMGDDMVLCGRIMR
ncbi:2,5-diamino-6-(ribosylamino)-4(3H)-pyrimidinone 5'-phosphate reductase [Diaporthe australafricana]|uniref:2,5-diamino-6-ribosylamino-4(3H)-pyrimidinone 5'-phosphate reductase n=1 Tax=Diaporthe australafricana TaxID=127596 RepID=A0ABR3XEU3_9PEZI